MTHNQLLSWTILLVVSGPLLAYPITDSAEMPYSGPVSVEDRGIGNLDDLSLTEQDGLRYPSLIPGELNGVRSAGLLPRQMKRENLQMILEKQSLLNPFGRFLGIGRKHSTKRGENVSECFWKYCV